MLGKKKEGRKKKEERKKINFQFQNQASTQQDPLSQVASLLPSPLSPLPCRGNGCAKRPASPLLVRLVGMSLPGHVSFQGS